MAVDDYIVTDEDTPVIIDFMANDYDVDDSFGWDYTAWSQSGIHGALEHVHNYEVEPGVFRTVLRYTPGPDWYGTCTAISYGIQDSFDAQASAQIFITVNPVNDAPVAMDDYVVTDEDTPIIIDFMANDYDVDDTFSLQYVAWGTLEIHGQLDVVPDYEVEPGVFRYVLMYTPDPDWHGSSSSISYGIQDMFGAQSSANVYITVNPVNDAPVAVDDYVVTDEDTPIIIDFMANDYDVDDDFDWSMVGWNIPDLHGEADLLFDYEVAPGVFRAVVSYTPDPNWYGSTSTIYYSIRDSSGAVSSTAYIHITVNSVNDAPVGVDDSYTIDEDTSLTLQAPGVLSNDYDVDGDSITLDFQTFPQHGDWTIGSNGFFNYKPPADWFGTDSFTYRVFDGTEYSGVVTVTVIVNPVNDAPVAVDDYIVIDEDTPVIIDFMGNDYDVDGDAFDRNSVGWYPLEIHGQWEYVWHEVEPGVFRWTIQYTPDQNWHGTITPLQYTVRDSLDAVSNLAYICITVNSVNDAPVAADDAYTTDEDTILQLDLATGVIANDFDIDGDVLTALAVSGPSYGTLSLNTDGSFSYTPNADWFGVDSFVYEVSDGAMTDTATVTVKVNSVNDAPVAVNDTYSTLEDVTLIVAPPGVLANDFDVDGDPIGTILLDMPLHGIVLLEPDGAFTYIPDPDYYGYDTFTYQVFDGTEYSDIATVIITVIYVNTPPTAYDDAYTTEAGVPLVVEAPGVLANDVDVDVEDVLEALLIDSPMHGIVVLDPKGSFTYIPDIAWCGVDTFTYNVFDGR
ncbi:MAG: Ig-like domain-containing protein [Candidatus Thorarchaeota archaeon]